MLRNTMASTPRDAARRVLGGRLGDRLILPDQPGYDDARRVFNGMIDRRPAVIARCATPEDVAAALRFGQDEGLLTAVRAGGHSSPGYSVCDDGLVIDLKPMKGIRIDAVRRRAFVGGGVTWGELDPATQAHGLAVTGGRQSTTGVAGFTLGSGSGWLERSLGLAPDNLRGATVMTASGELVRTSADENPELLWGLRGGGGNFGVVTEFEFELHPVGPTVYGGVLLHRREGAAELLGFYRDFIEAAPDALCGGFGFLTAKPAPHIPVELHWQPVVAIIVLYNGPVEQGEELIRPLRAFRPPVVDLVGPVPYTAFQTMGDAGQPWGMNDYFKSGFANVLSGEAIDSVLGNANEIESPWSSIIMQPMGGAVGRVGESETALGKRDARWAFQVLSLWPDSSENEAHKAWTRATHAALSTYTEDVSFPNFIADANSGKVADAYSPETWARLVALKDRYDPGNVLRHNHNIPPSQAPAA